MHVQIGISQCACLSELMTRPWNTRPSCRVISTLGRCILPFTPFRVSAAADTICALVRIVPSGSSMSPLPLGHDPCSQHSSMVRHRMFVKSQDRERHTTASCSKQRQVSSDDVGDAPADRTAGE